MRGVPRTSTAASLFRARSAGISPRPEESLRSDTNKASAEGARDEEANDDRPAVGLRLRERSRRARRVARRYAERNVAWCGAQRHARERRADGVLAGRVGLSREVLGHGAGRCAGPAGRDRARTFRAVRDPGAGGVRWRDQRRDDESDSRARAGQRLVPAGGAAAPRRPPARAAYIEGGRSSLARGPSARATTATS